MAKIAVYQGSSVTGDINANFLVIETIIKQASLQGIDLVLFPELFLCGYDFKLEQISELSLNREVPDVNIQRLLQTAKLNRCGIAVGYSELGSDNSYYNSCIVISANGEECANYRKTHLWDPYNTHEKVLFKPGNELFVFDYPLLEISGQRQYGTIKMGVLICFDCEFPEPARTLALQGATVILNPTALASGPVDDLTPTCTIPARALENHVFLVYSNLTGSCRLPPTPFANVATNKAAYCGMSAIVGPNGRDLVRHTKTSTGLLVADIIPSAFESDITRNDYLRLRRPELYKL